MIKSVEIIGKFDPKNFDTVKKTISLEKSIVFTDSDKIKTQLQDLGCEVKTISYYTGYNNELAIKVNNEVVSLSKKFFKTFNDINYEEIGIGDILKLTAIREIRILSWIKCILEDYENVVFLFRSLTWWHFCILDIAKKLGFDSKFGVSIIKDEKVNSLNFKNLLQKRISNISVKQDISYSNLVKTANFSQLKKTDIMFLIINDPMDLYARPIWNILDRLTKEGKQFTIFANNENSMKQIQEHGYISNNFSEMILEFLSKDIPKKEVEIIKNFIDKSKKNTFQNLILDSYLSHIRNDITLNLLKLSMIKIAVLNNLFEKINPYSLFVTPDGTPDNNLFCQVAKKYNINSFHITLTQATFTPIHTFFFTASKLCISGDRAKQRMIECGIDENRLIITGDPKYDYIPELKRKQIERLQKKSKKLIVVANSRWKDGDEEWMSQLIHYCNEKNYDIVIRPHPAYNYAPERIEYGKKRISEIHKRCNGLQYSFSTDGPLKDLLVDIDVLISDFSTSGMEATLSDIPLILANIGQDSLEWGTSYMEEEVVLHAETLEELYKCINTVLHDKETQQRLEKARKEFCYNFNFLNDGRATERIFQLLL